MAEQSISYGIGLSDQQLNAMLNSDIPSIRQQAEDYVATAQSQQAEKPNILNRIGNFFFPPAASAEPDFNVITGESTNTTNQFPFKSMADMAAENKLALNQIYSPPADTLTSLPNFQENYYLNNQNTGTGITQTNAASQFEEPFIMSGGQKIYISDRLGMQQAEEKGNVFNRPRGILSQAKDFVTQTLPRTVQGGLDTLTNFIPGMRFIKALDKFDTLPYMDRKFIKSTMDQKGLGTGIYVDPSSGAIKDVTGKNVRSLLGNYAETVDREYNRYEKTIERMKDKYNVGFDGTKFTGANADVANQMNKFNLNAFNFYKNQRANKKAQERELLNKVKAQVAAGVTAAKGQAMHGGGDGGGSKSFDTSKPGKEGAFGTFGEGKGRKDF